MATITGITGTSQVIPGLTSGTSYRVRVRAVNDNGASAWSTYVTFTTTIPTPAGTLGTSPLGTAPLGGS